jgi:DNA-binding response OmpR family regulator
MVRERLGWNMLPLSNAHDAHRAESADLNGMCILLVEDSWNVGVALKRQLQTLGLEVAGPVATAVEAERLMTERQPDAAIVDFNLRGGEKANGLINRLHDQGVCVIVASGYSIPPMMPGMVVAILEKPIHEAQLVAALRLVIAQKSAMTTSLS